MIEDVVLVDGWQWQYWRLAAHTTARLMKQELFRDLLKPNIQYFTIVS